MDGILKKIGGSVLIFLGILTLLDAVFVEEMWGDESIVRMGRLAIGLSLIGVGFLIGFKPKQKTKILI